MEPPHGTDDLHIPQDLSTSALPPVLDLTRRGVDQCALVRRNSAWYHNAESNHSPDPTPITAQHRGQIQPDNAFSHTTVTLSYVSRSHVFSTHDSLSGNSVYGVPTFSKYSLQPPCEFEETGVALNQHNLDNVDGASDLSVQTDVIQPLSQAHLELEANAKETYEFNRRGEERKATEDYNENSHEFLQNGKNLWLSESLDICDASLPECPVALKTSTNSLCNKSDYSRDQHDSLQSSSTVLSECSQSLQSSESLLESSKLSLEFSQDCHDFLPESSELLPMAMGSLEPIAEILGSSKVQHNNMEGHENSQQNSSKTLEVSTVTFAECENLLRQSQEQETEDVLEKNSPEVVFVSSTPEKTVNGQFGDTISPLEDPVSLSATSLDNIHVFMLPEASSLPSEDNSLLETTENLSSTQETTQLASEDCTPDKHPVCKQKSVMNPPKDGISNVLEENLNNKVLNGNAKIQRRMMNARKQPMPSTEEGMSIESVVMNINSSRYNVSGSIRTCKKNLQFDNNTQLRKSTRLLSSNKKCESEEKSIVLSGKKTSVSPENCRQSTSGLELRSTANSIQAASVRLKRKSPKDQRPRSVNCQESQIDNCVDITIGSALPMARLSTTHCPSKTQNTESSKKPRLRSKAKGASKKKQKIFSGGNASSMFSPKEPEIQLKYVNYKEGKRDSKMDCFKPFIRVQCKEPMSSSVTVVNYPDEVKTATNQNQSRGSMEYVSAVVPTTSCLHLGRATMQGDQQRALVCCLCGQSANAMDLGDLHGPYYSEGYKPPPKKSKEGLESKEEDSSNSDVSDSESCNGNRKWRSRTRKQQWKSVDGKSPAAKRTRADTEDWYSPPVVPLGNCEYWLHEDCAVWSVGVFLVRGKVYGLEEAVRVSQATMCSSCGDRGASLGCLFKGCPNKYHYRCALHSDCVLMEENFSIKCRKHKNKTMKACQSRQKQR